MKITLNEETGVSEMRCAGVLTYIPQLIKYTQDKIPYRNCIVEITYPNGRVEIQKATLLEKLKEKNINIFKKGNEVGLVAIIINDKIDDNSFKVGLPIVRCVDLSKFNLGTIEAGELDEVELENVVITQVEGINASKSKIELSYKSDFETSAIQQIEKENFDRNEGMLVDELKNNNNETNKGCIAIAVIIICLIISLFVFSFLVDPLGFLVYPIIVAGGFGLAKITEPFWYNEKNGD